MAEHDLIMSDLDGLEIDDFDPSEYLGSEQAVAAYLTEALESNDASMLATAVGNVARARGMTEIAKASGLAREALYKALRPNSQPRMETITRVLGALGVRLVAEVIPLAERTSALAFAPMKLPNSVIVSEEVVGQNHVPDVAGSGKAVRFTKAAAAKRTAKPFAKANANSAVAKAFVKQPAAENVAKRAAAKPAPAKPASAKPAAKPAAAKPATKTAAKRVAPATRILHG